MKRRQLLKNASVLLGTALSPSVVRAIISGVDGHNVIRTPRLDDHQRAMCRTLSEIIIPATDTPGAIEAGVPHFIELMVSDWYTETERGIFISGLHQLDEYCQHQFSTPFLNCLHDEQEKALTHMEIEAGKYHGPEAVAPILPMIDENQPFFTKLKELTVLGYYMSEVGATQELKFLPMPMEYHDIDFSDVGRQWSY
jgi:hypothetical protein